MTPNTKVVNVKVQYIRPSGYNNLEDWCNDSQNVYIGRRGIVFVNKQRYPKQDSPFCNPFKITKTTTREKVLMDFRTLVEQKLRDDPKFRNDVRGLRGKTLGCWCHPEGCHGDILKEFADMDENLFADTFGNNDNGEDAQKQRQQNDHANADNAGKEKADLDQAEKKTTTKRKTTHQKQVEEEKDEDDTNDTAKSVIRAVEGIKVSLSELLSADELSPEGLERCQDLLQQLENYDITLEVLAETLIGKTVSKFKKNPVVGPKAKLLIKNWKQMYRAHNVG